MTEQLGEQNDLAAGIFGDVEYLAPQPAPKDFKPWHKPRKQFVRREQWSALLHRLYEKREPRDPLRYLGLPGTDLLDLRYLHQQLCRANKRPLHFLGFNTEAQPGNSADVQMRVSLDEVLRLPNVDSQSDVINDDFRRIGNRDSIAWHRTLRLGPFDVVNIDLCDGLGSDPASKCGIGLPRTGSTDGSSRQKHQPMAPFRHFEDWAWEVRRGCRGTSHEFVPQQC